MTEPDYSHMTGDARKRLLARDCFDNAELHAHLDVDPLLWMGDES
jgi:hypothetical protein